MEKLVYMLWRHPQSDDGEFNRAMLNDVAPTLGSLGARATAVNLVDEAVAHTAGVRMTHFDPPMDGMVSFWLDNSDDRGPLEEVLAKVCSRLAAYLVVESVPLLNTAKAAPPGQRMPGINVVACIEKPAAMDYQAWLDHWLNEHKRVAIETQSVFGYVRNVVVRRLSPDGPAWDGIVEETFPAQAVTDPMLWYDAGGSKEKMQRNLARMLESVGAFLEVERVESNPMSQYLIGPGF